LLDLDKFEVALVGTGLQVRAVRVEHTAANELLLKGLLDDAIEDALLDVRARKAASTVLAEGGSVRRRPPGFE